jgi:hypothetical protein
MIKRYVLQNGPSREQLIDSLRLGESAPSLEVVNFWGTVREGQKCKEGRGVDVVIEGVHRAGDVHEFFFYGREVWTETGRKNRDVGFVYGRWNTHRRGGVILLGEESFFTSPVDLGEED